MLRDCEELEIRRMMKRLLRINNKLFKMYEHTENADRENLAVVQAYINGAISYLALVGEQDDMDN